MIYMFPLKYGCLGQADAPVAVDVSFTLSTVIACLAAGRDM